MDFIVPMGCESLFTTSFCARLCTSRLHKSSLFAQDVSPISSVCVAADCNAASSTIAGPTDPLENMEIEISKGNKLGSGFLSAGVPADKIVLGELRMHDHRWKSPSDVSQDPK